MFLNRCSGGLFVRVPPPYVKHKTGNVMVHSRVLASTERGNVGDHDSSYPRYPW